MYLHESKFHSDDGTLQAVVTVVRNPAIDQIASRVWGSGPSRRMFERLRQIPFDIAIVQVYYPALNRSVVLNANPLSEGKQEMDLSNIYAERKAAVDHDVPIRMLAPLPTIVPEDGIVKFVTVETIQDVIGAAPQAVLLIPEDASELLECIVEHPSLFGFSPMVLSGLPSSDYSAKWEAATYTLERVAYPSLVNDLVERKRVSAAVADERESPYERERKQFTRKSGDVKELRGVKIAGAPDESEETEPSE